MWNFAPSPIARFTCAPPRRLSARMLIAARARLGGRVKFRPNPPPPLALE